MIDSGVCKIRENSGNSFLLEKCQGKIKGNDAIWENRGNIRVIILSFCLLTYFDCVSLDGVGWVGTSGPGGKVLQTCQTP